MSIVSGLVLLCALLFPTQWRKPQRQTSDSSTRAAAEAWAGSAVGTQAVEPTKLKPKQGLCIRSCTVTTDPKDIAHECGLKETDIISNHMFMVKNDEKCMLLSAARWVKALCWGCVCCCGRFWTSC